MRQNHFCLKLLCCCAEVLFEITEKTWHSLHSHRDEGMTRRTNFLIVHFSDTRRHWELQVMKQVFLERLNATCSPKWAQSLPFPLTELLPAHPPHASAVVDNLWGWRWYQHLSKENPSNACKCNAITKADTFTECSWDFLNSSRDQPAH